jgi:hypothetical protein
MGAPDRLGTTERLEFQAGENMKYTIAECATDDALERSLRDRTPVRFVLIETNDDDVSGEPPMTSRVPFVTLTVTIEDVARRATIKRVFPDLEVREGELLFVGRDDRGRRVAGVNAVHGPLFTSER